MLQCVNGIKLDTDNCLKPCSGLIVNAFTKDEQNKKLENLLPVFDEYNEYKKITKYPSEFNGKGNKSKGWVNQLVCWN